MPFLKDLIVICQDETFVQLEAKIDKLIQAFEKHPMYEQPRTAPKISQSWWWEGGDQCCKWVVYKSGRTNEPEEREPEQVLHPNCRERERERGSGLRQDQGGPQGTVGLTPLETTGRQTN